MAVVKQEAGGVGKVQVCSNSKQFSNSSVSVAKSNSSASSASSTLSSSTTTGDASNQVMQQLSGSCCAGCQMPIKDRFIFCVIEQNFHQDCVRCVDCSANLRERCYTFEGKLYCRIDYWRRFGPKCSACEEPIKPRELVQRVKENLVYHLTCFVCQDCKRHLEAGEQLHLIDESRLLCKRDYLLAASARQSHSVTTSNCNHRDSPAGALSTPSGPLNPHSNHPHHAHLPQQQSMHSSLQQQQQRQQNEENENQCEEPSAESRTGTGTGNLQRRGRGQQPVNGLLLLDELGTSNEQDSCLGADNEEGDELDADELDERASSAGGEGVDLNLLSSGASSYQSSGQGQFPGSGINLKGGQGGDELMKGGNSSECGDDLVDANGKRRGPRTTIKPKQLETLRRAFDSAQKPSRHIREQLAAETGLNMRVIQVWFQNRRSKERRMKNSNGSARRNFFRSSSRRLRVGGVNTPSSLNGSASQQQQQQSLIAGRRAGNGKQQNSKQLSPSQMDPSCLDSSQIAGGIGVGCPQTQQQQQQQQQQGRAAHNSPSEFGGSSSGGFTYFSDSSNQGDAFAINTTSHHQAQQSGNPQQSQYLSTNGPQDQTNLLALESPSSGGQSGNGLSGPQQQQVRSQQQSPSRQQQPPPPPQQQQYGHQSMKNTPPPTAPPMFQNGPPPHMMMPSVTHQAPGLGLVGGGAVNQMSSHSAHSHPSGPHQLSMAPQQHLMKPGGMGALLGGHPQGPTSVVQW